jgi:simple sugar transport system ATP-binding protein
VERFFEVVLRLRASGRTIVIVTHRLDEVLAIASACTVLRRGRTVHSGPITGHTIQSLGRLVVGPTALPDVQRPPEPAPGEAVVLSVADLEVARGRGPLALAGVSLSVRRGEILGLAGVEGNGQDVLVEAIAGLVRPRKGTIALGGRDLTRLSVRERLRAGVAHIPEDRRDRGVVLGLSIGDNLVLGREGDFARHGVVRQAEIDRFGHERVRALDVRPPEPSALVGALSGGNQQKVVVGRELGRRPQLLLAAQPTRGVDLGASARIHAALTAFAAAGGAVLLLSADLGELLALSHRVVVFRRGRVVAERRPAETTARDLGAIMVGAEPTGGVR